MDFERKDAAVDLQAAVKTGVIEGYASLFNVVDSGGDIVAPGAYRASLERLAAEDRKIKMLWQHDPNAPIGIWDDVREDDKGLYVKGRVIQDVTKGREALKLVEAGAVDGLSIGYRTINAHKDESGRRILQKVELWEVSIVTFPMLPSATIASKTDVPKEIVERLKAGDRLTEREFEKLAKGVGLSNSQAERAARIHLKGQGEPVEAATEAEEFFAALLGG
jgi:HK97 family phage prohead protease